MQASPHRFDGSWLGRSARRGVVAIVLGGAAAVAMQTAASAHVHVKPEEVPGGDFSQVAFTVPNERDDASTVQLRVILPPDQPLASVQTTPIPGWTLKTQTRKLSEPIDFFGSKIDTVVSELTWKATDGGIAPGEFQNFPVSLGVLPESGQMRFSAIQTYSSGEVVKWNEVSVGDTEAEHPAPVLTLTEGGSHGAEPASMGQTPAASATSGSSDGGDDSNTALPLGLSIAALIGSVIAIALSWRRGRA
jgi:periplasmic copper chaperone A